jgi:hypothetical protein
VGQELGGLRGALGRETARRGTGRHRGDVLRGIGVRAPDRARHDLRGQRLRIRRPGQGLPLGLLSVRRLLAVLTLLSVRRLLAVLTLLVVLALLLVVLALAVLPL